MDMIFEVMEYIEEKSFKLDILKMKVHAFLGYKNLKRSRARNAKSKIKTLSKFKRHKGVKNLPSFYK